MNGLMEQKTKPALIHQSTYPSIHSESGQRGRSCTCDPSVPNRVRWLLRYAPIALTAVTSGQEKRRTLTLARSCGKIIGCSSRLEEAHFDKEAPKTQIRASSSWLLQFLKWRSRWDLHPHSSRRQRVAFLFSYGSLKSKIQIRNLKMKMVGSAGNAPVRLFRHIFYDARFTVEQPDHFPENGSGDGSCTRGGRVYEARLNLILPAINLAERKFGFYALNLKNAYAVHWRYSRLSRGPDNSPGAGQTKTI